MFYWQPAMHGPSEWAKFTDSIKKSCRCRPTGSQIQRKQLAGFPLWQTGWIKVRETQSETVFRRAF
jgi:hypothetical protein